ncbi:transcriptional regulator [Cupriavidus sp. USMAA2-4]|uniref:Transcriptional regulator n=1 Tax=Cupriavidus malaysiensis TaxID=367825 RepID=A0ABM7D7W8_9BURK|nr:MULTISPECIES: helix-turn-helix domain-containing protein [Cupriavidus]AOY95769.1 transcriptional regulator [Cupriavidus sp. USMAA2-4]AOZ08920.1 transcriptional regulator [Cupriavidus malaysiensis]
MSKKIELPPDAFLKVCPSRAVLSRIGQKWTVLAMVALQDAPMRFGDIRRRLEGVSQKVLTQTLRAMERDGLIERNVYDELPLRVEYMLSPLAHTLLPLVVALKAWAEDALETIEANNRAFDLAGPK